MFDRVNEIIFATNFSDACTSAIPSVARYVDALQCRLTLLHVYNPYMVLYRDAERLLGSFFAEADHYPRCERVLIAGDVATGIRQYCQGRPNAMLMLPPSDRAGLPRPWHRSIRARMISELDIPMWTLGRTMVGETTKGVSETHIGVWVSEPAEELAHVAHAAEYAARTGASLHLLHVVPDTHEGTLTHPLYSTAPLGESTAEAWLQSLALQLSNTRTEVHVAQGDPKRCLPQLLRRAGAPILFVNQRAIVRESFFGSEIHPIFRGCPASFMCVPTPTIETRTVTGHPVLPSPHIS